ncbi:putative GABA permease [Aspergillus clavatus NRRL 1]|uniref:Amino acid permease, putative n=1 Tax=Aspergillus clavatus (strain ATCC 1007 / CBS 513.65 / DSM 816 / NCTC 3887 / NRRL 1 / QM 1276 / 107) TaxID=344612 RepID=A1CKQ0_ASPCL|nr:amino acid permease, putative [Aspergillus clavatus NRRL 1]EAW09724.1 amino acid permease, putative [Aspergillus clavatus NRRL 1]
MAHSDAEKASPAGYPVDDAPLQEHDLPKELPERFSALSALSFAYVVTNSWVGYSGTFTMALLAGGGPALFFGVIAAANVSSIITLGLAELASAFPSSGGQYHFTYMVSSPGTRAPCAFVSGWLSCLAWCLSTVSGGIFCAQAIVALASFLNEGYRSEPWQTYLVFLAILILGTAIVCLLSPWLPRLEACFFWSSMLAFVVCLVTVIGMSPSKQPPSVIFTQYDNRTGWNDGFSFLIGVGSCMYIFGGTDAATHIAEEVPDPGRNIPRVMWLTPAIGIATTLPFVLATLFSTFDLNEIVHSELPILTLYYQATGSRGIAVFLTIWLLLNYFGGTLSCIATSGRLTWAFARDNGLLFSRTLATVHPGLQVPVAATVSCALVMAMYGLIYIASSTAFNSIVSMSILSLNVTYVIPQGIVLFRGRDTVLVDRRFNLGRYGVFVNAFSCLWVCLYTVIYCFPTYMPPTMTNMNYLSPVVVGIVMVILMVWYGGKRKTFVGPVSVSRVTQAEAWTDQLVALYTAESSRDDDGG